MARARDRQRQRRALVVAVTVTAIVLLAAGLARGTMVAQQVRDVAGTAEVTPEAAPNAEPLPLLSAAGWPQEGSGSWRYAPDEGSVLGDQGDVLRFRVAVEEDLDVAVEEFTVEVESILADPRGWTAGGEHRFQRVAEDGEADFEILLATPGTSEELCAEEGFHTERFTSCHVPGRVVINVARWLAGVPDYGAPLVEYRAYAINHEVGHELGFGHEACPGSGQPAPVMLPQSYGRGGCEANGWPYLRGSRHSGPKIP